MKLSLVVSLLLACASLATPSLASDTHFTTCAHDAQGRKLCTPEPETVINPAQLLADYPNLLDDHTENKKILCPFLRMMVASGMLRKAKFQPRDDVVNQVQRLGMPLDFAESFVDLTILAQRVFAPFSPSNKLNVETLHRVALVSHNCGLNFPYKGTTVDATATLADLSSRQDANGQLKLQDFKDVKLAVCEDQNVDHSQFGVAVVEMLFSFLGGSKRGVVDFVDVERVFSGRVPFYMAAPDMIGSDWGLDV